MRNIAQFNSKYPLKMSVLTASIALYQATILNIPYYKQVLSHLALDNLSNTLFFLTMPVVVFCVIFATLNLFIFPKLIKFIGILFVVIGAPLMYFMLNYGIMVDKNMLQNALETDRTESQALLTPALLIYSVGLGILPALLILFIKTSPVTRWSVYLFKRASGILIALLIITLIAAGFFKDYATFMRNNHDIIKYLLPSNYIGAVVQEYRDISEKNLPFTVIGKDARLLSTASNGKKTVTILVLGETSRAQNFSLYGYNKETNPLLSQQDIAFFKNTASCGTSTAYSVPCMFSNMTRAGYNATKAAHQSNALDILKKAGVDVLWRDNDGGCKDVCTRVTYEDMTAKNSAGLCKNGVCYDDVLFDGLPEYLDNVKNDTLVILHTIGSHGPTYYQRYPDAYKKFISTCDTNEINRCDSQTLINTYDSTILYVDTIVNKAITLAKSYQNKYNTTVIYLSDHGESLGENGIYLHSMPYSVAPEEQTRVPFLLWLSDGYQAAHAVNYPCLKQQASQNTYSHDNLFHSLLGLFSVQTQLYEPALDVIATCKTENHG